ncbi:hypothetical protein C9439_02480 [archaeon SCG-AAA382B04]|nr:hypothetical protein C9439_02480 [archaeon SCG-AAA382B04]
MFVKLTYERENWNTTNTGDIDHLIYSVSLFDENEDCCWRDGELTLKMFNDEGEIVSEVRNNLTEEDFDFTLGTTKAFRIEESQIKGPVTEAKTFIAKYETKNGTTITTEEKNISVRIDIPFS